MRMNKTNPATVRPVTVLPAAFLRVLVCLSCLVVLSGCGASRPMEFYMLDAGVEPVNVGILPETIVAIGALDVPSYLDRQSIVVLQSRGTGIEVPRFNTWAEPLAQGIRRVLAATMTRDMLDAGITVLAQGGDRPDTTYSLHVEIQRLDCDTDGHAVLEARWGLLSRHERRMILRGGFALSEDIRLPPFGSHAMFDEVVAAESRLVQAFGRDLTVRLLEVLRNRPHAPAGDEGQRARPADRAGRAGRVQATS